ncbi:MAG: hypothetical protein U0746_03505 [Gemmataceae bacterium]
MLGLALIFGLLVLGCSVLFAAITGLSYGLLYSAPAEGLPWRAPLAGLIVGAFLSGWCLLERSAPGRFDTPLAFSPVESTVYERLWSERRGDRGVKTAEYTRGRGDRGSVAYFDADGRPWARVNDGGMVVAIIIEENDQKKRFEPDMNPDGTFRIEPNMPLRFVEKETGRAMTETTLGTIQSTRWGLLIGNVLLNLAHLIVWWLCFWLVMNYQWTHALAFAFVLWLLTTFVVWPVLKGQITPAATVVSVQSIP